MQVLDWTPIIWRHIKEHACNAAVIREIELTFIGHFNLMNKVSSCGQVIVQLVIP